MQRGRRIGAQNEEIKSEKKTMEMRALLALIPYYEEEDQREFVEDINLIFSFNHIMCNVHVFIL